MAPRRIRGQYQPWYQPDVLTLSVVLRIPRLDKEQRIDFLIDTGAANTTLMPLDSIKVGLDFARDFAASRSDSAGGIGGEMRLWLEPSQITMQTDAGLTDVIALSVAIAQPSEHNLILPSPLGRDILQYYRFVADGRTREVFLERDEA